MQPGDWIFVRRCHSSDKGQNFIVKSVGRKYVHFGFNQKFLLTNPYPYEVWDSEEQMWEAYRLIRDASLLGAKLQSLQAAGLPFGKMIPFTREELDQAKRILFKTEA